MSTQPLSQDIDIRHISPLLLRASIFNREHNPSKTELPQRAIYDYEMEYILYSEGAMWLDHQLYPLQKGDLIFRRPGQITQGIKPYSCYLICFDLTGNSGKIPQTYDFKHQSQYQVHYRNPFLDALPSLYHPHSDQIYESLFDSLFTEFIHYREHTSIIAKAHLLRLLYQFHTDVTQCQPSIPLSPHFTRLKRSIDFMRENYATRIILQDIAKVANLSPAYFHRIFTATFQATPNEYLIQIRLDKAKELLAKTSATVNQISALCGFENTAYFCYLFKQRQKCSPTKYRAKYSYL